MRIKSTKTNSNINYYVIKDFKINGKRTTKIIEKLGTDADIRLKFKIDDVNQFLNDYINKLNIEEKKSKKTIIKFYNEEKIIELDKQYTFNGGYLFLQDIYYSLKLNNICDEITNKYQFKYDLNNILSNLIYSRIIYPSSKLKTLDLCKNFLEQPKFEYHHILRALEILNKENDFIQSELYKNSLKYSKRNDKILFYDCTNYYFEIEDDDEFRKYGKSKEHRPNPIVGMGLFMDGDGIPLTFSTFPGNQNEQTTLKPLEEKIIKDFDNSKFVVCTDAGLSSNANKKFNNTNDRKYVTTQSLKKLKSFLKDWSLDLSKDWHLFGSDRTYVKVNIKMYKKLKIKMYKKYTKFYVDSDKSESIFILSFKR